jgi:hypothetical protein
MQNKPVVFTSFKTPLAAGAAGVQGHRLRPAPGRYDNIVIKEGIFTR